MRQHEAARALAAGEPLVSFFPSPLVALSLSPKSEKEKSRLLACCSRAGRCCVRRWLAAAPARSPSERKSHPWVLRPRDA
jgi:hypothetical protein